MAKKCFVYGCTSGYDSSTKKVSLFKAPYQKGKLKKWLAASKRAVPKAFGDIFFCSDHFKEEDILKFSKKNVPLKRWKLKKGAIPIWNPHKSTSSPEFTKGTERILKEKSTNQMENHVKVVGLGANVCAKKVTTQHEHTPQLNNKSFIESPTVDRLEYPPPNENENAGSEVRQCLPIVYPKDVLLPIGWHWVSEDVCIRMSDEKPCPKTIKKIEIKDGVDVLFFIKNQEVFPKLLPKTFSTLEELKFIIWKFESVKICQGISDQHLEQISHSKNGIKKGNIWRSKHCQRLCNITRCISCSSLSYVLKKKITRMEQKRNKKRNQDRIKIIKRKLTRRTTSLEKSRRIIQSLRQNVSTAGERLLNETLENLGSQERMVINAIMKKASCKDKRGMRYDAAFLMECLLLRIRSKCAYTKISERKLLPLPSPTTIRRLLSSMVCSFGLNDFALASVKRHLADKSKAHCYGSLVWDEMSIAQELTFNSQKLQFDGHVDYGEGVEIKRHEGQLADKALVFIFRPYLSSWIQPIGVFAAKGAVPGEILHELITKAIVALKSHNAIVKSVVCDGAQSNKLVMKLFGVSGALESDFDTTFALTKTSTKGKQQVNDASVTVVGNGSTSKTNTNEFNHPLDEDETIYFFVDVPHLFKCVRNYIFEKKIVQFQGLPVEYRHFELLYQTDKEENSGSDKRIVPKWTDAHLYPTNFQKMCVRLAVQVLSNRAALGFRYYRTIQVRTMKQFIGTEHTEKIVQLLNDAFDVMNGRIKKNSIDQSTWNKQKAVLDELLDVLFDTEIVYLKDPSKIPFLSPTTLHAMRVTICSTQAITSHLLTCQEFSFVLTGKFNQDCIERFFGIIRAAGGGQEQPTVSSFMHLFRMLCMYYPVNYQVKNGNVDNDADMHLLTSYKECLLNKFRKNEEESRNLKAGLLEILQDTINYEDNAEEFNMEDEMDHPEELDSTNKHIIYDLSGYLLHARQGLITCNDCWDTLQVKKGSLPGDFLDDGLVALRDRGGLKWASPNLHSATSIVEKILDDHFQTPQGYMRDSFEDVMFKISSKTFPLICCDAHRETLVPKLIYEYVVIRFRFKGKNFTNSVLAKAKANRHSQRKQSKL